MMYDVLSARMMLGEVMGWLKSDVLGKMTFYGDALIMNRSDMTVHNLQLQALGQLYILS